MKAPSKQAGPIGRARLFLTQWRLFLREFVRHPAMVGSVIPTSATVVDRMLNMVDWPNTGLFVEYGPGVGTFTTAILDRLRPDATLLAIELNPDFVAYLAAHQADARLRVVHGSAADVRRFMAEAGHEAADYILSGLPFSALPDTVAAAICAETGKALKPGGHFLIYQYSRYVRRFIAPVFPTISNRLEWRNIPPARLFCATMGEKPEKAA